jgi:ankyrin repeat protein
LLSACSKGHSEVVEILLENKANLEANDKVKKNTPIRNMDFSA